MKGGRRGEKIFNTISRRDGMGREGDIIVFGKK